MENTGISKQTRKIIQDTFTEYPEIDKVILYGSRAKGNYQHGSDIDITLYGNDITLAVLNNLSIALDDLLLPYTFDISIYEHIDNKALIQHIESFGKIFYIKNRD